MPRSASTVVLPPHEQTVCSDRTEYVRVVTRIHSGELMILRRFVSRAYGEAFAAGFNSAEGEMYDEAPMEPAWVEPIEAFDSGAAETRGAA